MTNITSSFTQRCTLIPKLDLTNESQIELLKTIFKRHGEDNILDTKVIDENDDYDSFLVETDKNSFLVKTSFDQISIFYEYTILKGIENLSISPIAIDRGEVEFGQTIYYTISTYEHSNNINELGNSTLLDSNYNANFNIALNILHKFLPPLNVRDFFDNDETYLQYHKINFNNISKYVDSNEVMVFNFIQSIYNETYEEMMTLFNLSKNFLNQKSLVHGNLDSSTIITNSGVFKFINFENSFIGNQFFDLANIVFELQTTGINEFDFVSKRLKESKLIENRFKAKDLLQEYKICKYIWVRKKFLDIIKEYIKEIIINNKEKTNKVKNLGNEFSKHFYRFDEIKCFSQNRDLFINEFSKLILN